MRRFLCLSLVLTASYSCGVDNVAVDTPPAPQQSAPTVAAADPAPQPSHAPTATLSPGAPVVSSPGVSAPAAASPAETVAPPAPELEEAIEAEEELRVAVAEEIADEVAGQDPEPSREAAIVEQIALLQAESRGLPVDAADLEDPEQPALAEEETALIDELTAEAIPEDYSIPEVRERRLLRTESDLPLTLNSQVARRINYFGSGRGRGTIRATLGRAGAFRTMIERILEEEDVPKELFHLAQAESGFRPKARSYARATGMWQFMSFRGKQYGLRQDRNLEERYDPENATRAAARHLKDLYIEFGDWYLAMAAYNCGPGRVTRAIARGKTRDYWELSRRRLLPRQTRDYVPIILAMTYVDKNLDMYDVGTIDFAPVRKYDTVEIADEVSLELLADLTGTSATALEDLNPALARSATPPYRYDLRIPQGSAEGFHQKLAAVPADKRLSWRSHEVRQGDTVADIAKRYKVAPDQLIATNGLSSADAPLTAGLRLNVPAQTKLRSFRRWGGAGGLQEAGTGRYRVANGDTLGAIARRFGVSVAQLRAWNGLPNTFIRAGRYLVVRPDGAGKSGTSVRASSSAGPAPSGRYRVRRGDTLGKIAARHGTSVSRLMAWNGLRSTRIGVGQTLKVPGASNSGSSSSASAPTAAGPGQYRIRSGDNLGAIATRFGVTVSDLKSWNGLRSSRIRAGNYLRVRPPSSGGSGSSAPVRSAGAANYKVQRGDSLDLIARRNGVTVSDLKRWNNLSSSRIQAGQMLKVGGKAAPAPQPVQTARASAPATAPRSAPAKPSAPVPADGRYLIRSGDTLGHIAEKYGVRASDLRRWNNMRGSRISAGKYLNVRPPSSSRSSAPATQTASSSSGGQRYRIRSGDTLELIAKRFNCSIADLKAWNGLRSSRIRAGAYLTVKPGNTSGGE